MKKILLAGVAVLVLAAGGAGAYWKFSHVRDPLANARTLLAKGDTRGGSIELRNAVRDNPQNGEAHFQLGALDLQTGDPVAAEKELKAARVLGASHPEIPLMLAQAYLQQVNLQPGNPVLSHARDVLTEFKPPLSDPNFTMQLLILRSVAQTMLKDQDAAQASLDEAEKLVPTSATAPMAAARAAFVRGDLDLAQKKVDHALEIDPKRADAYVMRGQLFGRQNQREKALDAFNAAVSLNPKNMAARLEQANMLVQLGQNDKAKTAVDSILADQPQITQGIYLRALLLVRSGDYAGADAQFQRILNSIDRFPRGGYFVALEKYNLGQVEQAVDFATRYVARVPGDPDAPKLLARILLADGKPERAITVLQRAANGAAADAEILDMLGRAYSIAGRSNEAVQSFGRASNLEPTNTDILSRLAAAKLGAGDTRGATADLTKAMELSPGQAKTAEALVVASLAGADIAGAKKALATLREQTGSTETVGLLSGQILMREQNFDGAKAQFENLLATNSKLIPARFALAQVLAEQGKTAESDQALLDILNQEPADTDALGPVLQNLLAQNKVAQGVTLVEAAHTAAPANQTITIVLANLYVRINAPDKAITLLAEAEKAAGEGASPAVLAPVLFARAQAQMAMKQQPAARATLQRILQATPADMNALGQLVNILTEAKDWEAERTALRQALIAKPGDITLLRLLVGVDLEASGEPAALATIARLQTDPVNASAARTLKADLAFYGHRYQEAGELYSNLYKASPTSNLAQSVAHAYALAGQPGPAKAVLQDWLNGHPDDVPALSGLGTMALEAGQFPEAQGKLEAALALQPTSAYLLNNLAVVYQSQNNPKALETARRAYQISPSGQSADTLGWVLFGLGQNDEAMPLLARAAQSMADNPTVQFHLAAGLKATGKPADAVAVLEKLTTKPPFPEQTQAQQMLTELKAAK